MADYSQYKTETLKKMQNAAFAEYYKAAVTPCGDGRNFSKSPTAKRLTRLTERYEAISAELEKRMAAAEYKGHIVGSCGDYQQREDQPE